MYSPALPVLQDYESAATHIATFMDLESRLAGSLHAVDAGQAESQRQVGVHMMGRRRMYDGGARSKGDGEGRGAACG